MPNRKRIPSGDLTFDQGSGWVSWKSPTQSQDEGTRLCWLPAELRSNMFAFYEGVFAVASLLTQQLTIIDFTPMLNSLRDMEFINVI
jgi:hypothetical protein